MNYWSQKRSDNIIKYILFIFFIFLSVQTLAQNKIITQPINPHPILELNKWQVHAGDLNVDKVFSSTSKVKWVTETINQVWWEKNSIKWYKTEVIIPTSFNAKDILMEFRVDPTATIYVDGAKVFRANQYRGSSILVTKAKAGKKYTIALRAQNFNDNCSFFQADLIAFPQGYAQFYRSKSMLSLNSAGIFLNNWKRKLFASDDASKVLYDDSDWENITIGDRWEGEGKHAWYRTKIKVPNEINGFSTQNKAIRVSVITDDRGVLYINGIHKITSQEKRFETLLTTAADTNKEIQLAIKVNNFGGPGNLGAVTLITEEENNLKSDVIETLLRIDRVDRFIKSHPKPNLEEITILSNLINFKLDKQFPT